VTHPARSSELGISYAEPGKYVSVHADILNLRFKAILSLNIRLEIAGVCHLEERALGLITQRLGYAKI